MWPIAAVMTSSPVITAMDGHDGAITMTRLMRTTAMIFVLGP